MKTAPVQQTHAEIGEHLFRQGYRVFRRPSGFYIRKPDGKTYYQVNPYLSTCNCPAGNRGALCKHLNGLPELVFRSAVALVGRGQNTEAIELLAAWGEFTKQEGK